MKKNRGTRIKQGWRYKTIRLGVLVILALSLYQLGMYCIEPRLLPIRHIKIYATCERVNLSALKHRIAPHIKGFFSTHVIALKHAILLEPFVEDVMVKRVWSDTLLITLHEIKIVARLGKAAAISSKGEVVNVKLDANKHLPIFNGEKEQVLTMLNLYNNFSDSLRPLNLIIAEIDLNRHSWQITLDNGIKISLSDKDRLAHLALFISVYPKLKKNHGNNIKSIDLRHLNGLSVHLNDEMSTRDFSLI
jgi:cell division septal protein FtsQ